MATKGKTKKNDLFHEEYDLMTEFKISKISNKETTNVYQLVREAESSYRNKQYSDACESYGKLLRKQCCPAQLSLFALRIGQCLSASYRPLAKGGVPSSGEQNTRNQILRYFNLAHVLNKKHYGVIYHLAHLLLDYKRPDEALDKIGLIPLTCDDISFLTDVTATEYSNDFAWHEHEVVGQVTIELVDKLRLAAFCSSYNSKEHSDSESTAASAISTLAGLYPVVEAIKTRHEPNVVSGPKWKKTRDKLETLFTKLSTHSDVVELGGGMIGSGGESEKREVLLCIEKCRLAKKSEPSSSSSSSTSTIIRKTDAKGVLQLDESSFLSLEKPPAAVSVSVPVPAVIVVEPKQPELEAEQKAVISTAAAKEEQGEFQVVPVAAASKNSTSNFTYKNGHNEPPSGQPTTRDPNEGLFSDKRISEASAEIQDIYKILQSIPRFRIRVHKDGMTDKELCDSMGNMSHLKSGGGCVWSSPKSKIEWYPDKSKSSRDSNNPADAVDVEVVIGCIHDRSCGPIPIQKVLFIDNKTASQRAKDCLPDSSSSVPLKQWSSMDRGLFKAYLPPDQLLTWTLPFNWQQLSTMGPSKAGPEKISLLVNSKSLRSPDVMKFLQFIDTNWDAFIEHSYGEIQRMILDIRIVREENEKFLELPNLTHLRHQITKKDKCNALFIYSQVILLDDTYDIDGGDKDEETCNQTFRDNLVDSVLAHCHPVSLSETSSSQNSIRHWVEEGACTFPLLESPADVLGPALDIPKNEEDEDLAVKLYALLLNLKHFRDEPYKFMPKIQRTRFNLLHNMQFFPSIERLLLSRFQSVKPESLPAEVPMLVMSESKEGYKDFLLQLKAHEEANGSESKFYISEYSGVSRFESMSRKEFLKMGWNPVMESMFAVSDSFSPKHFHDSHGYEVNSLLDSSNWSTLLHSVASRTLMDDHSFAMLQHENNQLSAGFMNKWSELYETLRQDNSWDLCFLGDSVAGLGHDDEYDEWVYPGIQRLRCPTGMKRFTHKYSADVALSSPPHGSHFAFLIRKRAAKVLTDFTKESNNRIQQSFDQYLLDHMDTLVYYAVKPAMVFPARARASTNDGLSTVVSMRGVRDKWILSNK